MANATMPNDSYHHSWKPEPLVRGTFSILSSSLLTMILCVWTAVHLNVPEYRGSKAQMWRKIGWMAVAVFAPELIVFTAYCEHISAKDIGKIVRKAFDQPERPGLIKKLRITLSVWIPSIPGAVHWPRASIEMTQQPGQGAQHRDEEPDSRFKRCPWTQAHSLYSTMGGFVVDTRSLKQSYLPDGRQRMTLTPEGLKFIADNTPDLLPDLPESAIVDKSKANAFTKLVTCAQALWFGIQCVTRSAQGLSISLLEINTAVHALCTLFVYFAFWWHKPLDVEEPTVFTNADTDSVIAFLVICDMFPQVRWSPMDMEDDDILDSFPEPEDVTTYPGSTHIQLRPSKDPRFPRQDYLVYHGFAIPTVRTGTHVTMRIFHNGDFERFKLASDAAKKYGLRTPERSDKLADPRPKFLAVRLRNRPVFHSDPGRLSVYFGLPQAGMYYGLIHGLVGTRPFRGETDKVLWMVSCMTFILTGLPFYLYLVIRFSPLYDHYCLRLPPRLLKLLSRMLWLFLACFVLFYVFCRIFIIVECFLDVFHLPDSAFEVPRWSQYFPHIS